MRRLALMPALFLAASCAAKAPVIVPDALLAPVAVHCADGATMRALGECALRTRAGLDQANGQIAAIARIEGAMGQISK